MSELVLAVYDREDTAEHVLALIHAQRDDVQIDFESAAIVRVGTDGGITVTTTDQLGSGKSLWGVLWEALFGLIFLVPAPRTAYGSNLGALFGAIDRAGLDAAFRSRVRAALGRGTSGLGLLASDWNPDLMFKQMLLGPEMLLRASIVLDQDSDLMRELGGGARHSTERSP
jgi:uncharacterized membrane protein